MLQEEGTKPTVVDTLCRHLTDGPGSRLLGAPEARERGSKALPLQLATCCRRCCRSVSSPANPS